MINASARPFDDMSTSEAEAQFDAKIEAAFSTGNFDSFLDFALVVYAKNLDTWISKVANFTGATTESPAWMALRWTDNSNATWFSAVFHLPHTQVLVEVISESEPSASIAGTIHDDPLMRYPATGSCAYNGCADATDGIWIPLAVSKAVSDADRMQEFYETVLGASVASVDESQEGIRLRTMYFPGT